MYGQSDKLYCLEYISVEPGFASFVCQAKFGVLTPVFLLVYGGREGWGETWQGPGNLAESHCISVLAQSITELFSKRRVSKAGCQYSNLQIGLLFNSSWFTWDGSCFLTRPQSHVVHLKTQPVIWQFPFCICNDANAGTKSSVAFLSRNNHTLLHSEWYSRG